MLLEEVVAHIASWIKEKRTGSIQVNFFKGGISNINITQCIKTESEDRDNGRKNNPGN